MSLDVGKGPVLEGLVLSLLGASRVGRAAVVGVVEADDLLVRGDAEEAGDLEDEPEGDLRERERYIFLFFEFFFREETDFFPLPEKPEKKPRKL